MEKVKEATYWAVWVFEENKNADDTAGHWMEEGSPSAILVFHNKLDACEAATVYFGLYRYPDAKRFGPCEVRPFPPSEA